MHALIGQGLRHIFYLAKITQCKMIIILSVALIFRVATAQFLDVSEEKVIKVKENTVALIITLAIMLKQ